MSGFTTAAGISYSTVTTTQQAPLGFTLVVPTPNTGNNTWIYVFNDEPADSFLQGMLIQRDLVTLTYDGIISTGAISPQRIMGVAQHTIAAGSYGFILRDGIGQILCDGNVSQNTAVCPDANAGQATDTGGPTAAALGVALANDAGAATKVAARIFCVG